MLNLDETRVVTKFYFKEWFPPVLYDLHQMGRTGARLFVPPFLDPLNPNIHPLIWRGINLLGTHMAEAEEEAGHTGVAQNILYTSWWEGNSLQQPWFHNMVSVLTEAASPDVASPVTQKLSELTGNTPGLLEYALRENFSNPWPGGTWRLRDVVEYEYTAAMAVLDTAARYREDFLRNFYNMGREEINKGETEPPYAYVVPATQRDPNTAVKMINLLIDQGAEVHRANSRLHGRRRHLSERVVCASAGAAVPAVRQGHHGAAALSGYPRLSRRAAGSSLRRGRLDAAACRWV